MFPYGNIRWTGIKFVKFHIAALMIFSDHIITLLASLTSADRVWSAFELFLGYWISHVMKFGNYWNMLQHKKMQRGIGMMLNSM